MNVCNSRLKESHSMNVCVYVQSSSGLMGQNHGAFRCEVCFKDNVNNTVLQEAECVIGIYSSRKQEL